MENKNVVLENEKLAMKVSRNSIYVNSFLSIVKFIAGFVSNSSAMISDAVHSASDVFTTIVVMIGIKISNKEADSKHQYGHERYECIAAIFLGVILCLTGLGIGYSGIMKIINSDYGKLAVPGILAVVAAILSIVVKEGMYWYTIKPARKINSSALMADAWDHRSDALSSVGSLVGILAARMGYPVFDPLASVIICIFIIKASYDIFKDAIKKLIDESCDEETEEKIKSLVLQQDGVIAIDEFRTRQFGSRIYVDVEILVDGELKLIESHDIAQKVHDEIEEKFVLVKHCMVHVNPYLEEKLNEKNN